MPDIIFQSRKQECKTVCFGPGVASQRDILKQELSKIVYAKYIAWLPKTHLENSH